MAVHQCGIAVQVNARYYDTDVSLTAVCLSSHTSADIDNTQPLME
jgi:hypothetical protein